jgi:hypothetical protein
VLANVAQVQRDGYGGIIDVKYVKQHIVQLYLTLAKYLCCARTADAQQ